MVSSGWGSAWSCTAGQVTPLLFLAAAFGSRNHHGAVQKGRGSHRVADGFFCRRDEIKPSSVPTRRAIFLTLNTGRSPFLLIILLFFFLSIFVLKSRRDKVRNQGLENGASGCRELRTEPKLLLGRVGGFHPEAGAPHPGQGTGQGHSIAH